MTLPYFIGCKLEALFNRGMRDLRLSKDFEDIAFLLHYYPTTAKEIVNSVPDLKEFIKARFKYLLNNPQLNEAIFCVLPAGENDPDNIKRTLFAINQLIHNS